MATINPRKKSLVRMPQRSQHAKDIERLIVGFKMDVDLSDLRQAFNDKSARGNARYMSSGSYEAADKTLQAQNEEGRGVYRLRIRLMDRDDLTFYLNPNFDRGDRVSPTINAAVLGLVSGLKLFHRNANALEAQFITTDVSRDLEVRIKSASLPENEYTVVVYKR